MGGWLLRGSLGPIFLLAAFCAGPGPGLAAAAGVAQVDALLGLPYRDDGALDQAGRYTRFKQPTVFFSTPGLNCSGFVVAAARALLGANFTLEQAKADRAGDSGPDSPLGEHWDFGFDLIGNLTAGRPRVVLLPEGILGPEPDALAAADGLSLRGFGLHDDAAWERVLARLSPGWVYFASWSKPSGVRAWASAEGASAANRLANRVGLLHYHVSLLLADGQGQVWMYHATPKSGVHRLDLASKADRRRLHRLYAPGNPDARILIVGVKPE